MKLVVRVFVRELRSSRVGVETEYGASDLYMRAERYLWHTLKYHILITEFREVYFHWHTSMEHSVVNNLFKNIVANSMWKLSRQKFGGKTTSSPNRKNI